MLRTVIFILPQCKNITPATNPAQYSGILSISWQQVQVHGQRLLIEHFSQKQSKVVCFGQQNYKSTKKGEV